jgi:hypothetical protein
MVEEVEGDGESGKEGFLVIEEESSKGSAVAHVLASILSLFKGNKPVFTNPAVAC